MGWKDYESGDIESAAALSSDDYDDDVPNDTEISEDEHRVYSPETHELTMRVIRLAQREADRRISRG